MHPRALAGPGAHACLLTSSRGPVQPGHTIAGYLRRQAEEASGYSEAAGPQKRPAMPIPAVPGAATGVSQTLSGQGWLNPSSQMRPPATPAAPNPRSTPPTVADVRP